MKKILLTLAAAFFALASVNAQLTQVVVESASDGSISDCPAAVQPAGTTTYRIYAELNDATDFLSAVYAIEGCYPLDITTTTDFYNTPEFFLGPNPFNGGGKFGHQVNTGFCFFEPGLGFDSWFAIGGPNSGSGAQDIWTNPADPLAGLGDPANSGSISAQDGSWFVLNGDPGGVPTGPNNRVLLGQFTTDGDFSYTININIFDDGDNVNGNLQYIASSDLACTTLSGTMIDGSALGLIFPAPAACDNTADLDYCYDSNELTTFVYTASQPGEQVSIAVDGGTFEGGFDVFTIYDGTDNTGAILFSGDGDVTGVTATSTTGALTVEIDSDSSNSCASGDQTALDATITCGDLNGCTDGAAANFNADAVIDDGSCVFPPANDDCSGAIAIAINDPATFVDVTGASAQGPDASCHFLGDPTDNDLWYSFVAAGGTTVITSTAGTVTDAQFAIYDACGGNEVACNDDTNGLMPEITADCTVLIPGTTYYLQVDTYEGEQGDLTIQITNSGLDGCTDATAVNFDACAQNDDGSCTFDVPGCTDMAAVNFDAAATVDDGSCIVPGCADPATNATYCYQNDEVVALTWTEINPGDGVVIVINAGTTEGTFDTFTAYDGTDNLAPILVSGDGDFAGTILQSTGASITLEWDSDGSVSCASLQQIEFDYDVYCATIFGCTDATATNFDANALTDDGSCDFAVPGCTDMAALNFDAAATADDGSCIIPGCATPADQISICYDNSVTTSVTLTEANAGEGVTIEIISGSTENIFDDLNIYDGADNLATLLSSTQGDASGIILQSSGASLTIEIVADGSNSCASGGQAPLVIDVYCAQPVATGCTDTLACNFLPSATLDDGSCEFTSCAGCTDPTANNYDPTALIDDGSCVFTTINDVPTQAFSVDLNIAVGPGAGCTGLSGEDITAATINSPQANYSNGQPDLWYSFVTTTSGVVIDVITANFDAVIEVFDNDLNQLTGADGNTFADDLFVDGDERFMLGDLTAGNNYFVRVEPWNAPADGTFDICIGALRDTRCDYGPGPYSLCGLFKADFVYADNYIFNFTSQTDAMTYSSDPQSSTFLTLSNVDGLGYGDTYDVAIQATYDLPESDGDIVTVIVENDEPCTVEVSDVPATAMAPEDNSTNAGPQFLGNYIEVDNFVCGAESYTWRFTRTDVPEIPVTYNSGSATTLLRISDVLTEAALGGTFDVEVKPEFSNGMMTSFGAIEELAIIGIAGTPGDIIGAANDIESAEERVDETVVAEAAIYPNPNTGDFINLNVTNIPADVEVVNVIVRDLQGRAVQSEQFTVAGNSLIQVMDIDLASGM